MNIDLFHEGSSDPPVLMRYVGECRESKLLPERIPMLSSTARARKHLPVVEGITRPLCFERRSQEFVAALLSTVLRERLNA